MHRLIMISLSCLSAVALSISDAVSAFARFALALIARPGFDLTPRFALDSGGGSAGLSPIAPSLMHRNRHEAGMSRMAATRNV